MSRDSLSIYSMTGRAMISPEGTDVARRTRIENITPYPIGGGALAPQNFALLNASAVSNGQLDISSVPGISFKGSMAASVVDGNFAATATTTTITWYWDGTNSSRVIVLRRPDGHAVTIPPGSITVTGLVAGDVHVYYPAWSSNGQYQVGWAPGVLGDPQIAFGATATASQRAQGAAFQVKAGMEALTSSAMSFPQPAVGTSSGTGGGGGTPGQCVLRGTRIKPVDRDLPASDWKIEEIPEENWVTLETKRGLKLTCTADHPVFTAEHKEQAQHVVAGDWLITELGLEQVTEKYVTKQQNVKLQVMMRYGHLYWANGFLSSNLKWNGE